MARMRLLPKGYKPTVVESLHRHFNRLLKLAEF